MRKLLIPLRYPHAEGLPLLAIIAISNPKRVSTIGRHFDLARDGHAFGFIRPRRYRQEFALSTLRPLRRHPRPRQRPRTLGGLSRLLKRKIRPLQRPKTLRLKHNRMRLRPARNHS